MLFKVIGIEKVDYKSRRTGNQVRGTNLYVQYPSEQRDGLVVVRCDRLYVKDSIDCSTLSPGDDVEIYYNRFGNVDSLHLA